MAQDLAGAIVTAAETMQRNEGPHGLYACVYALEDGGSGTKFGVRGIPNLKATNFKFMENLLQTAATKGYYRISGNEAKHVKEYFDSMNRKVGRETEIVTVLNRR